MSKLKLTEGEMDQAAEDLFQYLITGKGDEEAQDELGVDTATYGKIKRHMLDRKAVEIHNRPTEHVYVQYILDQAQNLRVLTDMIKTNTADKNQNAVVGAIRLRADLYDRIITKGQECGLIEKEPERREIIAGVIVADLTNRQLQGVLKTELFEITQMMSEYGTKKFIDVELGPIHHGPALKPQKQGSKKRGKKKQRVVANG